MYVPYCRFARHEGVCVRSCVRACVVDRESAMHCSLGPWLVVSTQLKALGKSVKHLLNIRLHERVWTFGRGATGLSLPGTELQFLHRPARL